MRSERGYRFVETLFVSGVFINIGGVAIVVSDPHDFKRVLAGAIINLLGTGAIVTGHAFPKDRMVEQNIDDNKKEAHE